MCFSFYLMKQNCLAKCVCNFMLVSILTTLCDLKSYDAFEKTNYLKL